MRHSKGFTLIELLMGIVILGIAVSGTLMSFNAVTAASADPMIVQQAIAIGKSYLEEVVNKDYPSSVPCGAPPGGGRSVYTDICDYDGLSDSGAKDQTGASISGLGDYTVTVDVETSSASLGSLTSGTEVVRIDVSVDHERFTNPLQFSAYRTAR